MAWKPYTSSEERISAYMDSYLKLTDKSVFEVISESGCRALVKHNRTPLIWFISAIEMVLLNKDREQKRS